MNHNISFAAAASGSSPAYLFLGVKKERRLFRKDRQWCGEGERVRWVCVVVGIREWGSW